MIKGENYRFVNACAMVRIHSQKDRVIHRLKIVRGQLDRMIEMVENDTYCIDILHNSLSVQKALKKIDGLLMDDHIRHCVVHQAQDGQVEKLVHELRSIYSFK